jgi:type VII secretion integral membrane protein EccD
MSAPSAQLCRLIVVGPNRRVELAVPANIPIADLLPTLLGHLGPHLADTGLDHEGWILQRLGDPPLDEDLDAEALGLRDGETVYLRARGDQIPPADFDDLIDGIATGLRDRAGAWRPEMTRWAGQIALAVVLLTGMVVLARPGPTPNRASFAAVFALLALVAAGVAGRVGRDRPIAALLAFGAIGYAALAGLLAPGLNLPAGTDLAHVGTVDGLGAANLAMAVGVALPVALVAALAIGGAGPVLAGFASAACAAAPGPLAVLVWQVSTVGAAGVVAVCATVLSLAVPMMAFRLSGMRLAPLPTTSEQLQEDIEPEPSVPVLERTAVADRYMTGLYTGLAAAGGSGTLMLALNRGWAPPTLAALIAVARALSARTMTSGWHRFAAALPALVALPALAATVGGALPDRTRLQVTAVVVPLAALVVIMQTRALMIRRPSPYLGRFGDIVQTLVTVAQIPVLLALLGAFGAARGIGG